MLFDLKKIECVKEPAGQVAGMIGDDADQSAMIFKNKDELVRLEELMQKEKSVHYMSAGAFSSHDLLFFLLDRIGKAKVYLTTWTMTEYPARLLTEALLSGSIEALFCILDVRMHKNDNVYQLIRNNSTKIRISHCHAKVIVIEGNGISVSVISSQNMTENPRIECGVITSNPDIAAFHREWILNEIEHGHTIE